MIQRSNAVGIAFIVIGIALFISFNNRAVGMGAGVVFFILGIVFLLRKRTNRT